MTHRYAILWLLGFLSFSLLGQNHLRLLTKNEVYKVQEGDFSGFDLDANTYNEETDRFHGILQFKETPSEAEIARLTSAGIHFDYSLPIRAYVVSIPKDSWSLAKTASSFIEMPKGGRFSQNLYDDVFPEYMWKGDNTVELELIISNGPSWETAKQGIARLGFNEVDSDEAIGKLTVQGAFAQMTDLNSLSYVLHMAEGLPPDEKENDQARVSHRVSHIQQVHPTYDGRDVVCGVGDDEQIGPHLDFEGRVIIDYSNSGGPGDDHGDHVSGTVLGAGNIDPFAKGMAPGSDLVYYPPVGNGHFQRIDSDYDNLSVFIHNSSYASGCNSGYNNQAAELDNNSVEHRSYLHVFSAGNNGNSPCANAYIPGVTWGNITGGHKQAKNVVATAALTDLDVPAGFSSKGPATDGRIKPDIAAVGVQVYSTGPDNIYFNSQGTSMSAPGAAGTLSVLYSAYKQTHSNADPAGGLMKNILLNTADDKGNPGPDFHYGYGRVNAKYGVEVIENDQFEMDTISQGQIHTHTISVPTGLSDLKIMVNWVDPQGFVGGQRDLVNNLDITLTAPDGSTFLPWVLDPTPTLAAVTSDAVRAIDSLNNKEQVTLANPSAGSYTVTVTGTDIMFGPQEYFLTYHFIEDEIDIDFPAGGEVIAPFQTELIRWSAPSGAGNFTVELTPDDGQNWFTLSSTVSSADRHFTWNGPPATFITDEARIRVTQGGLSDISEKFSILGRPGNLSIVQACPDSTRFTWNAVSGATHYELLTMGSKYMDSSMAVVDTNYATLTNVFAPDELWFSVRAMRDSTIVSERSLAIFKSNGVLNCTLQKDLGVEDILWPGEGLQDCQSNIIYPKVRIVNNGVQDAFGFDVDINYSGPGASGSQSLTINDTIVAGQMADYTFSTPLAFNSGQYSVSSTVILPNDDNGFNDSLAKDVLVSFSSGLASFPDSNDLEGFIICSDASNCGATSCFLADGFQNLPNNTAGGDDIDWRTNSGSTPSNNTGPSVDYSTGTSFGKYLYLEASGGCEFQEAVLTSPCIDLSNATYPKFKFWYHMLGTAMGELHVDVISGGHIQMDVVPSISGNQGNQWLPMEIDLSSYTGSVVNVRIRGITGGDFSSDLAIDHFSWSENSSAPIVDFLPNQIDACIGQTIDFADVSTNAPTQWEWKFFPNSVSFTNGTNANSQNPSVIFNGFGTYDVRLIASNPFGADSVEYFSAVEIPFPLTNINEDFENIAIGFPSPGFDVVNPDADETWRRVLVTGIDSSTTRAISVENFNYNAPGEEDWFVTPEITIPSTGIMYLKWDLAYAFYSNTYSDDFEIRVSTNCGQNFSDILFSDGGSSLATAGQQQSNWSPSGPSEWRRDSLDLSAYQGQQISFAFVNINGWGQNIYLDNINVFEPGVQAPLASIDQSDTAVCGGVPVNFNVPNSTSGVTYNWDFGIGANPQTAVGAGPHSVTYSGGGMKSISLSAGNTGGMTTVISNLDVTAATIAAFNYAQGATYLDYNFTSSSSGAGTVTYSWDFGDGNSSNLQNPSHSYAGNSNYTVTLTVTGDCGQDVTTKTINVNNISLEEVNISNWMIYPNPTSDRLTIDLGGVDGSNSIHVIDLQGRLLQEVRVGENDEKISLYVGQLSQGIYIIELRTANGVSMKRFQKN